MSKVAQCLRQHTRIALMAVFVSLLLSGGFAPISLQKAGLVQAAPLLTVSAGGPYNGSVGAAVSMTASVISGTTTSPVFAWNFGDGASGIGQSVSHSYASANSYHVTVSVIDSVSGASGFATTTATVGGGGGVLTVNASGPYSGAVGVPITMSAFATDASPQYTWIFGDGATSSGQSVTHAYNAATTYTITVYVRDSISGATGSTTTTAAVGGTGSTGAIQVSAGGPYSGTTGVPLTMSATATDANPSYTWNFGDGTTGYGQTASHAYGGATTYSITVTDYDLSSGLSGTASTTANTSGSASTYGYCNGTYELLSLCSSLTSGYQDCGGTVIPSTTVCGNGATTAGYQECNGSLIPSTSICGYGANAAGSCTGSLLLTSTACGYSGAYSSPCGLSASCGSANPYVSGYQSYSSGYQGYPPYGSTGGSIYSGASTGCTPGQPPCTAAAPTVTSTALAADHNPLTGAGFNGVPQTTVDEGPNPPTTAAVSPAPSGPAATYQTGWNLVAGLPGVTLSNIVGGPLAYQPLQGSYQSVDPSQLQGGQGYWVNFSTPTTVNVAATGAQPAPVSLPAGDYVLLGNSSGTTVTVSGADEIWTYNPTSSAYAQTTTLNPGQAGWAYSTAGATASFTVTGAATTGGSS